MEREPFDLQDYRQRLRDRCDDYEVNLDGMRVVSEIRLLRAQNERLAGLVRELSKGYGIGSAIYLDEYNAEDLVDRARNAVGTEDE